jgi:hypothetical protein
VQPFATRKSIHFHHLHLILIRGFTHIHNRKTGFLSDRSVLFGGLSGDVKVWKGVAGATTVAHHDKPVKVVKWSGLHGGLAVR